MSQKGQTPFKTLETNIKTCSKYVGPFWEVMYQGINTCSTKTGIENHSTAHHKLQPCFFTLRCISKFLDLKYSKGFLSLVATSSVKNIIRKVKFSPRLSSVNIWTNHTFLRVYFSSHFYS